MDDVNDEKNTHREKYETAPNLPRGPHIAIFESNKWD
jgi:hypothetical protein